MGLAESHDCYLFLELFKKSLVFDGDDSNCIHFWGISAAASKKDFKSAAFAELV